MGLLGGRVAEKLCLGDISTGASNDIQRASQIARKMVATYGMSDKIGTVAFESGHDEVFIGRTMTQGRSYSEAVAAQIDQEVQRLVADAYDRCERILNDNRDKLEAVASYLLEHETMEREAFLAVFGEQPLSLKKRGLRKGRRPENRTAAFCKNGGTPPPPPLQNCWSDGKMHQRSHWSLAKLPIRLSLSRTNDRIFLCDFFETSTTEGQMTGICGKNLELF